MICLELFLAFLKVGCFTFGGGYGAVPLIRDVVLSHGWLSEEMLTYMIAISESTPGPIMVNMATYIGSSQAGLPGALIATLAVALPSFLIILLIATLLETVVQSPWVQAILRGLKPCVVGIILATGLWMTAKNCVAALPADFRVLLLTALLAAVPPVWKRWRKKKLSPIARIAVAALAGIVFYGI